MIVKTCCARMDHGGCGILAHVENGKITKIEGDPESALNRGTICAKGLAQIERLNHPDRLIYPMKRMGERGEGKWKRISWDVALDTVAGRIKETIIQEGERTISFEPIVLIHPETASHLGIHEGDWVAIETKRGIIRQKATLSPEMDPRVIVLSFGWWFPEKKDLELYGWKESNLNILTENGPPYDPAIGSTPLRAVLCRAYKSQGF